MQRMHIKKQSNSQIFHCLLFRKFYLTEKIFGIRDRRDNMKNVLHPM